MSNYPPDPNMPDGVVDGEETAELMELGFDDSNAPTDGGGDMITDGDDVIVGNGGDDTIDGAGGNDTIFGDGIDDGGEATREIFQWADAPNFGDDNDAADFTQSTGGANITFDIGTLSGGVSNTFETTDQNTDDLDAAVAENASFESLLTSKGSSASYSWTSDTPLENVEFRVNDADGNAIVNIRAFDADGNQIEVQLTDLGSGLAGSDTDGVPGIDTVDSVDTNFTPDDSPEHSFLVTIPGPVARWELVHEQDGPGNTGINVTDIAFDVPPPPAAVGNDSINGGEGDDVIDGGPGNDTISGDAGNDSIEGGDGDDSIRGGTQADTISGGEGDDTLNGNTGGDLIDGGFGDDSINGGRGDDTIIASSGTDTIDGDIGRDTYDASAEGGFPPPNPDTHEIFTFQVEDDDDDLKVSDFSADSKGAGAQDFTITDGFNGDDDFNLTIRGNGGASGDGDNDIFRFDLAGFDDDFTVELKSEDVTDQVVFTNVEERIDNPDGTVTVNFIGSDGEPHTATVDPGDAQVITDLDDDDDSPSLVDETIEVIVDDEGDGTVTKVNDGTTDEVTSVENFIAGEADEEADSIELTDAVARNDIDVDIQDLSDDSVGIFTPLDGGPEIAFGPDEAVQLSDILNGDNPVGSYTITDGDEAGQVGEISFENFETITFSVACFVRGTQVATRHGSVAIEELKAGDEVITMDHGFQKIRWIGSTSVPAEGRMAPVVIRRGAMGNDRDLRVSPQHRMLVRGWHVELMFGQKEALVPAKALINDETVFQLEGGNVEYFHMMFDRHELVYAEGIPSESFHPGHQGVGSFSEEAREEIFALFPELRAGAGSYSEHARPSLKVREAKVLAENPELMKE